MLNLDKIILRGSQVDLFPMSLEYVNENYLHWLSDPEITRFISAIYTDISGLQRYVQQRMDDPNVCFWAICDRNSGQHIGNVKLEPINRKDLRATFGILIGNHNYWGRGICTEVTRLVSDYAFGELKLIKVDLGVSEDNQAAIRAYEKAGFHREGTLKRHQLVHNRMIDVVLMAKFTEL